MRPADPRFEAQPPPLAALDLAELFRRSRSALRRNLGLILAIGVVCATLGATLVNMQAPYYQARASIIIDPRVDEEMGAVQAPTVLLADALVVDSQVEVLRSEQVLRRVIASLGLVPEARDRLAAEGRPVPDERTLSQDVAARLAGNLDIAREGTTYVVRIAARAGEAEAAADIANAIADEYLASQIETLAAQAEQAGSWLESQLEGMSAKVRTAETEVERFLYANDLPDENARGAVEGELDAAEARMIAVGGALRGARAELSSIDRALAGDEESPAFHGQLVAALGGPADLRTSQIGPELARLREVRQARIDLGEAELAALGAKTTELKATLADVAEKQVRLRELRRTASAMQGQYESLLARFEASQGEDRFVRSNARIIERAVPPAGPANPSAPLTIGAAALGGLVLGLGLTFLREQLDDRLRRSDDVAEQLGIPYLGAVPLLGRRDARALPPELAPRLAHLTAAERREISRLGHVASAPYSVAAEPFRRTAHELRARPQAAGKVIAVVSALSGEGKSFFASNLAFFLARQGSRVLLVDGDLRNPHLSRSFAPLLTDPPAAEPAAMAVSELIPNLFFLYVRDPFRLDEAERQILAQAEAEVDHVVMDTAPLAYVSDALSLAAIADSAVLVVNWRRTPASTVRRVLKQNQPVAGKLVGACLSKTSPALLTSYEFIPANAAYYRTAPRA